MSQPLLQPLHEGPRPSCFVWYAGDPCDARIQQYNEALQQRLFTEWQRAAVVPLQNQIDAQAKLITAQQAQIRELEARIQTQTFEALQSEARMQALMDGVGAGLGVCLAFVVALAGFRRLARGASGESVERARAASAS